MPYTLTLLGTDTEFSPGFVDNAYDRAETLSYVSTLVSGETLNDKSFPTDETTRYRNSKVAVVNGPTTLGSEVGDRIARGVEAILEAISRGETDISIIAHSRGAVEAILVAHELERIQKLFEQGEVDRSELTNSVCKYTKTAMNGPHKEAYDSLDLKNISKHIGKVKISMFNIDPVPGGNYMGITHASSLAWRDPRFYTVPKIVQEYEQYTYENERTRCFKPIVPKCASSETKFKIHSLPGHHGTGSGNLLDQQRGENPTKKSTQHVQELVVVKLMDFLMRNGVAIAPKKPEEDPFENLMSQIFDGNEITKEKLESLYYELFNKIIENREAYRHFNQTSYAVLGQEQAIIRRLWNVIDQRIVHYQAHNDTYLETIVPPVPGGHFLNYEHARIHLNHELGLNDEMPLSETINTAVDKLVKICKHTHELRDLKEKNKEIDPLASIILDKIAPTLDTKEGFELFLEGLGMLIEEVKRPYLQGELTDPIEREALYNAVSRTFSTFKEYSQKNPDNELAKTILSTFTSQLETTLETKRDTLNEQYLSIATRLKDKVFFTSLQQKIQEIKDNLNKESQGKDGSEYLLDLNLQKFLESSKDLSNSSVEEIRLFLEQELKSLQEIEVTSELAENTQQWACLLMDEAIDESPNYNVENLMAEFIKAYNDLDKFKKALPDFKALSSKLNYREWECQLESQRDHIVHMIARYIVKEGLDLEQDIKPLFKKNEKLYNQVEGLAIGLGAKNPLELKLSLQIEKLEEESLKIISLIEQVTEESEKTKEQLKEKESQLLRLNEEFELTNKDQVQKIQKLELSKLRLTQEIEKLNEDVLLQSKTLEQLKEQSQKQEKHIQVLTEENEQHLKTIAELKLLGKEQVKIIEQLSEKGDLLLRLNEELKLTNKDQVQRIQELEKNKTQLTEEIIELNKVKLSQSNTIDQLKEQIREQEQIINKLTDENREYLQKINQLTLIQEKQSEKIKELTIKTEQQELTITQLKSKENELNQLNKDLYKAKQEQSSEIQQLKKKKEELKLEIKNLKQGMLEQKGTIEELSKEIIEQNKQIVELKLKNEEQARKIIELEAVKKNDDHPISHKDQEKLIQQLLSPKEISSANLIETQLIPLTRDYLNHLIEEARKINPSVTEKNYQNLPPFTGASSDKAMYEKIVTKYELTKSMEDILSNKNDFPLPSTRITKFTEELNKNNKKLGEHRDPDWKRYAKTCLIAIGVICTGIIPGIIALVAYSCYKEKASPLFFTNSTGKEYTEKVEQSLQNIGPKK